MVISTLVCVRCGCDSGSGVVRIVISDHKTAWYQHFVSKSLKNS